MKRAAFAVSILAVSVVTASAADMPVKSKPLVAAGIDWTGVYAGIHAGYGGGMKDWEGATADFVARGALAGGQIGINKQLGSLVFGLELDGSWADIGGSDAFLFGGPGINFTLASEKNSKIDSIATLAGRAGIAADRWFVFAKGGFSAAHEKHRLLSTQTSVAGVVTTTQVLSVAGSETRYAPMVGFGAEYALLGPWSVFAEYDYHHFGSRNVRVAGTLSSLGVAAPVAVDARIDQAIHVAKLGVNYRFGNVSPQPFHPPVPAAPGTDWTGMYVGAQGGYGWGKTQWPDVFGAVPASGNLPRIDQSGWLAGGSIGINAQSGRFVFGVEGEILATDIKGSTTTVNNAGPPVVGATLSSKIDWLAIASARAGFVVGDSLMLYGKGGVAIAEERHSANLTQDVPAIFGTLSGKAVHTGAVVGVGGEYAFAPNWSIKAEYDYIKMFAQQVQLGGTSAGGPFGAGTPIVSVVNQITQDLHLLKFGVNYHFKP